MQKITKLIDEILEIAKKNKNQQSIFFDFVKIFYSQNQGSDFVNYKPQDLYFLALSSFNFFYKKDTSRPSINIYNPTKEGEGFNCSLTIIDLVNLDMPFLVDSVVAHLDNIGIKIKNIIHPIYLVERKSKQATKILTESLNINHSKNKSLSQESVIQIHIERMSSEIDLEILKNNIFKIVETVNLVVQDWKLMVETSKKAQEEVVSLQKNFVSSKLKKFTQKDYQEIQNFISWINEGNFIFLGSREFNIKKQKTGECVLVEVKDSNLGVFNSKYEELRPLVANLSTAEVDNSVKNPYVIEILKSRYRSRVHRVTNAERIRIQKFNQSGEVVGEYRFVGLFTSMAYNQASSSIPLVRHKISQVIKDSGFIAGSHNHKELLSIVESYPRDELFQIDVADLLRISTGIVAICGRSQVKFFARHDKFNRFVSCLIYMPRERTNSSMRDYIKNYLVEIYQGEFADSFLEITESRLVRYHVIIRTNNGLIKNNELEVEKVIEKMTRPWSDDLQEVINQYFCAEQKFKILTKYKNSFSISYSNRFSAEDAVKDIENIELAIANNKVIFNLYQNPTIENDKYCDLKIYSLEKELILSDLMPILESFGFQVIKESTYNINAINQDNNLNNSIWLNHFQIKLDGLKGGLSPKVKENFEQAIDLIWLGNANVGLLNRLIIDAEFNWQEVRILRAYTKYIYQAGFRYSQQYIADILVRNLDITKLLIDLFHIKFALSSKNSQAQRLLKIDKLSKQIYDNLNNVKDAIDDAVIRQFLAVILATLRTNYCQLNSDKKPKDYVSFKLDCHKIPKLPLPLPFAEIFVYSATMEGVHLRGGKVARGGLRWSDRHEDFRTEVLGLVKAQNTKNAVIVPVGSKGGFVVKKPTTGLTREQILKDGIIAYQTFLRGMLDITDNIINGKIIHPQNTIIYDQQDPYLVVAADKGTATFSDIANSISEEYKFWLGDAFASGGSVGYDHKKMGITAKGAWISVMRHFREMGIDTQKQDFTAIGIGDLSGDVFGNGMMLSPHIRLIGAFNHLHIFCDPNPDAKKSFAERVRMFNLPRSNWTDYNQELISKGGGIFERSAKIIKLSPEIKKSLDIAVDEISPNELIKAMLKAPADLLWNGGIGTYFKASEESHLDVGDRSNEAVRINADEIRSKVVGEGGNLGFTQKARIAFALNGGRVNTDAMDNSAGVDCSDHEVNIKIALTQAMQSQKITLKQRNKILEDMTDDVAELVLADNRLQTQAISIASYQGSLVLADYSQFLERLEKSGLLNRAIEFLPSKKEIDKRIANQQGLTRPELSVMLAYSKMEIYNSLLQSKLIDDKYFEQELVSYFPKLMQKKFSAEIKSHQLKREIIATQITNFIVNKIGIIFVGKIAQDTGFSISDVIRNIVIATDSFDLKSFWQEIESLDGKASFDLQAEMFLSTNKLLERSVMWLLKNHRSQGLIQDIEKFKDIANNFSSILLSTLAKSAIESFDSKVEKLSSQNIDKKLAFKFASINYLASALEIAEIDRQSKFDLATVAKIYFAIGERFSLKWLRLKLSEISSENNWHKLSCKTLIEELYFYQIKITKKIIEDFENKSSKKQDINKNSNIAQLVDSWTTVHQAEIEKFDNFIMELKLYHNFDIAIFVVVLSRLKSIFQ